MPGFRVEEQGNIMELGLEVEFGCQWIPTAATENRLVLIRNAWLEGCGKKVGLPIDSNRFYVEIIEP